ncbi:hypothetical protein O6P37_24950 [Mycobacterium sp. CPCC 205372]|uniref:Uncharacterized protein n=1 Tax=Mycobacterium hippophais TaxID=3016340 RepID=A0ABT4PZW3_9MYCO|nr:hypothetical protein [Mycobacterium hippophais]MCZ8382121.1 hypothetical protein [Mycobacterium hippophais]
MNAADNLETAAHTGAVDNETIRSAYLDVLSLEHTQASAWSNALADLHGPIDGPDPADDQARTGRSTAFTNGVVAAAIAGAVGAFAVLGVVVSQYYTEPHSPAPVAVTPGAVVVPATPTAAPALPSVAAVPTVVTAPANNQPVPVRISNNRPAAPVKAPARPAPVAAPAPAPAAPPPAPAPAVAPAPVVIIDIPVPQLPPLPQAPAPADPAPAAPADPAPADPAPVEPAPAPAEPPAEPVLQPLAPPVLDPAPVVQLAP